MKQSLVYRQEVKAVTSYPSTHSIKAPIIKLTLGASTYESENLKSAKIVDVENGFSNATIVLDDVSLFPATVTNDTVITLNVKEDGGSYPANPLFAGIVRFPVIDVSDNQSLTLSCLGLGFGLGRMTVANEYGTESSNPTLNTCTEIATDIITNHVNKIFGGASSGYSYDTTAIASITDSIPYFSWSYKPAMFALNDLQDVVTAYHAGTAGPHWIVTTDNKFHMKLIDGTQTGWTKYYGDSSANATLVYGDDYTHTNFEALGPEANYILYYGAWRRPSNGDFWTENTALTLWGNTSGLLANGSYRHIVGAYSVLAYTQANPTGPIQIFTPNTQAAGWDFSCFTDFNTPNLNFYVYYDLTTTTTLRIRLYTDNSNYFTYTITPPNQAWQHYSIPVGPYFNVQGKDAPTWIRSSNPNWNNINWIEFYVANAEMSTANPPNFAGDRYYFCIDGLHFGDAAICRVAQKTGATILNQTLITDNIGKDDSLNASDSTGLMAKLAEAEYLRQQTSSYSGTAQIGLLPDALPGQWFQLTGADYRAPKIQHDITNEGECSTTLTLTNDVINSTARLRYEDLNKVYASIRPEWQDRQASNIKAGSVDYRIARIVKLY
jgi:hypothetical protein